MEERMQKSLRLIILILGYSFINCKQNIDKEINNKIQNKSLISIVEIPVIDIQRAINFYESLLAIRIEKIEMGDTLMGVIPSPENTVNLVLVKGSDYSPSKNGTIIYLDAGNDLQIFLNKVEKSGGKMITPKTQISSEMGYFAFILDSEGNKLGLHSKN